MSFIERKERPHRKRARSGEIYAQSAKKAPAATRTPTTVAPIPATVRAPLLPPLNEPVGTTVEELEEDELVKIGVRELEPEVPEEEPEERVLFPEEVEEGEEEVEERAASMVNVLVWESTELTFPTGEAWRLYPSPAGTAGRVMVMVPFDVGTLLDNANVLRKLGLTR